MLLRLLPGLSPRLNEPTFLISRPLRSTPTPASRGFTTTTGRSASERRDWYSMPPVSAVGTLPLATLGGLRPRVDDFAARLLTFRARAADQAHAAFTPGTAWPVIGTPARLITGEQPDPPLSMPPQIVLTTPQQRTPAPRLPDRALSGTSSWSPPDASNAPSPRSLTTTVFSQRSTGRFSALPRRTTLEGQKPPSLAQHRLYEDPLHRPPSAFVTHGCRTNPGGRDFLLKRDNAA